VATVLLVRHGRTTANTEGILAGRIPGIHLDDVGRVQATATGTRLAALPVTRIVTSPLERCQESAHLIADMLTSRPEIHVDERFTECGYGSWSGEPLKKLAKQPLWKVVQHHASAAEFPDGESIAAMQRRAVDAVRAHDCAVNELAGAASLWVAVSHADIIKSVVADACGMHLDQFQRIVIDPGSVSAVTYTPQRPFVVRVNDVGDLSSLRPPKRRRRRSTSEAVVGGGAGRSEPA
jgi:probable phosphomutase (TIGR03848 family)